MCLLQAKAVAGVGCGLEAGPVGVMYGCIDDGRDKSLSLCHTGHFFLTLQDIPGHA